MPDEKRAVLIADDDTPDYTEATDEQRDTFAFYSKQGVMSNGDEGYTIREDL